jgi:transcription-repair coupling factor (superfamily II helicase)
LVDSHRLRIHGKPLGIARIDASDNAIQLQFVPNPPIDPMKIIKLIQTKRNYKLAGPDRLRIDIKIPELKARVAEIRKVFAELG